MILTTSNLKTIEAWKGLCGQMGWGLQVEIIKGAARSARVSKGDDEAEIPAWIMDDLVKENRLAKKEGDEHE